jgi:cohesin loading factor subunit SCC2
VCAGYTSRFLSHILKVEETAAGKGKSAKSIAAQFKYPPLNAVSQSLMSALPRLTHLISRADLALSDSLVIQTVYTAVGPFFVVEPAVKRGKAIGGGEAGLAVMKGLRMEALGCLRGVSQGH